MAERLIRPPDLPPSQQHYSYLPLESTQATSADFNGAHPLTKTFNVENPNRVDTHPDFPSSTHPSSHASTHSLQPHTRPTTETHSCFDSSFPNHYSAKNPRSTGDSVRSTAVVSCDGKNPGVEGVAVPPVVDVGDGDNIHYAIDVERNPSVSGPSSARKPLETPSPDPTIPRASSNLPSFHCPRSAYGDSFSLVIPPFGDDEEFPPLPAAFGTRCMHTTTGANDPGAADIPSSDVPVSSSSVLVHKHSATSDVVKLGDSADTTDASISTITYPPQTGGPIDDAPTPHQMVQNKDDLWDLCWCTFGCSTVPSGGGRS